LSTIRYKPHHSIHLMAPKLRSALLLGRIALPFTSRRALPARQEVAFSQSVTAIELGSLTGPIPEAVEALRQMVARFIEVLDCLDTTFINAGLLDQLPRPGRLGASARRRHRHQPSSRPGRDGGAPRALPEPGGVLVVGARHEGRPAPHGRPVLAEPSRLRPREVPLQGVFTPIPREPLGSSRDGRAAPASRQGRLPASRRGIQVQPSARAPYQQHPRTNATPVFITRCEASSTPLGSRLEPHPQHFHDG